MATSKAKLGKMLTQQLQAIGQENTEMFYDEDAGNDHMITKVEALARKYWALALGKVSDSALKDGTPNHSAASLIFDRLEGKANMSVTQGKKQVSAAAKVSEQSRKRINDLNGPDPQDS